MKKRKIPEPKEAFVERISKLLPDKADRESYWKILTEFPLNSIRCNTLKISPENLKNKLEKKNWFVEQPWKSNPEIIIIKGKKPTGKKEEILTKEGLAKLEPGELGRALEHLMGYYYIQELSSMLPVIALNPKENETILDLCSAPGSKTTQIASETRSTGLIIANEVNFGRMKILESNLQRCGVTNVIITKKEGVSFCEKLKEKNFEFNKILIDAPCSGEGTLRNNLKTYLMWNIKNIKNLSRLQKQLFKSAFEILKVGGEIVYSTCTHAPEENEEVVDYVLEKFKNKIKILKINLPINFREGITKWKGKKYFDEVKKCARIYPQDNNTEGFFIAKFKKIK